MSGNFSLAYFSGNMWLTERYDKGYPRGYSIDHLLTKDYFKIIDLFESDPAKYSKILWNCSEEDGWQKIFKLLEIEK